MYILGHSVAEKIHGTTFAGIMNT